MACYKSCHTYNFIKTVSLKFHQLIFSSTTEAIGDINLLWNRISWRKFAITQWFPSHTYIIFPFLDERNPETYCMIIFTIKDYRISPEYQCFYNMIFRPQTCIFQIICSFFFFLEFNILQFIHRSIKCPIKKVN